MKIFFKALLFFLAVLGAFPGLSGSAAAASPPLAVSNQSETGVCSVRMSPAGENLWTRNLIGGLRECLYPGNRTTVPWNPEWAATEEWDVEVRYADGRTSVYEVYLNLVPGMKVVAATDDFYQAFPGDIDWDSLPRISTPAEAVRYFREAMEDLPDYIPVRYARGFLPKAADVLMGSNISSWQTDEISRDNDGTRVIYTVRYYPGYRVARAYLAGDLSFLTEEETALYRVAASIAGEAWAIPGELERELFIHNRIIAMTRYQQAVFTPGILAGPEVSAIGALLYRRANCQGFSDAFNMLGLMSGLRTGMWGGFVNGAPHSWNIIEINGRSYFVDVTNDQPEALRGKSGGCLYFNATRDIMKKRRYTWNRAQETGLIIPEHPDRNYICGFR